MLKPLRLSWTKGDKYHCGVYSLPLFFRFKGGFILATSSFFKTFIFDREKERSGVYNSSEHDRIKEGKNALTKFSNHIKK